MNDDRKLYCPECSQCFIDVEDGNQDAYFPMPGEQIMVVPCELCTRKYAETETSSPTD